MQIVCNKMQQEANLDAKKFQIKALSAADSRTGRMSKVTAKIETVTNKINAATRYPIKPDIAKQMAATRMIIVTL